MTIIRASDVRRVLDELKKECQHHRINFALVNGAYKYLCTFCGATSLDGKHWQVTT
jgi:hypothetical protein